MLKHRCTTCTGKEHPEVKFSLAFVKELDFLSPTQGLKFLREKCTSGKNQEIKINIS
jgi:hypothetical protein